MKIPLSWLNEYIDLSDISVTELCQTMTMLGLEIESVEETGAEIKNVVVGHILSIEAHPDADKLVVCKTDVGEDEPTQIVCGATNMKVGDKVPTAKVGGKLQGFEIGKRNMRGVASAGMMCSGKELGLGGDHSGLLILDPDMEVGIDVRGPLGINEVVLEIEVTPNRNDWSGLIGIARELSAFYKRPLVMPEISLQEGTTETADVTSVTIEAPTLCNRYTGRVIKGVTVAESPEWLQKRLVDAGQRPINNVVDITNYILLETGHSLHAFDLNKLAEKRIVVRTVKDGEKIKTIDEEERILNAEMLVIADAQNPVAIAGIMGGFDSEVGDSTVDLLIESAYFNTSSVRKTSRTLNLISEASQRFQRGADVDMIPLASDRTCQLILEIAGGELCTGSIDEYPTPIEPSKIVLNFTTINRKLGADISGEIQLALLESLGFSVESQDETGAVIISPPRRHDATREADLLEEIARLYGFSNIQSTLPNILPTEVVYAPFYKQLQNLRKYLCSIGLTEIYTWAFTSKEDLEKAKFKSSLITSIELENPLSEKNALMRPHLIPSVLNIASSNIRNGRKSLQIFEMAPVYTQEADKDEATQSDVLSIAISGGRSTHHWSQSMENADIFDLKGYLENIAQHLSGTELKFKACDNQTYAPGECAEIHAKGNVIGYLGRAHRSVAKAYDIDQDIYIAELHIKSLLQKKSKAAKFESLPEHPASLRDIAVMVDAHVATGNMRSSVTKAGGKLLKTVDIFDIYTGDQVPVGKKSVALSLTFQSHERTLTDKDMDKAWNKILKTLQHQYQAELR
jgi:phenylalanyl-tRNA synthetase beta chain